MKKYVVFWVFALLVTAHQVSSQSQIDENFLLKRFDSRITFDYLQEFTTSFLLYVEKANSRGRARIALRFCTDKEMKKAVTNGAIDLSTIYDALNGYGFSGKDILVLKSGGCTSKATRVVPTELWVINDLDRLPQYDEKFFSNEISAVRIRNSAERPSFRGYIAEAKKLVDALVRDKNTYGAIYIEGANSKVSKSFRKNILDILRSNGIGQSRYSIDIIYSKAARNKFSARFYMVRQQRE